MDLNISTTKLTGQLTKIAVLPTPRNILHRINADNIIKGRKNNNAYEALGNLLHSVR